MESKVLNRLKSYKRITVVGPIPPPLGGVSVYIYRLSKILPRAVILPFIGGGVAKYAHLFIKLLFIRTDVVFLNVMNTKIAVIMNFVLSIRKYKVYLMDHNDQLLEVGNLQRAIVTNFLNRIDSIIVVGSHILDKYLKLIELKNKNIWVENAFLPPPEQDREGILNTYPNEYFEFIKSKNNIINISAFKVKYEQGIDLYGIDMAINALTFLKKKGEINSGLLIFIADADNNSKELSGIQELININGLENDVLFILGQKELWPSYIDSTVSIRATFRDGFGVTVAESIYLGCPALASDVCERAEGAVLFESRNQEELNNILFEKIQGL